MANQPFSPPILVPSKPRCPCGRKVIAKGLCSRCYKRAIRPSQRTEKPAQCTVCHGDSGRPVKAKGLCSRCYYRQHKLRFETDERASEYARTVPLEERRRAALAVMQLAGLV